MSLTNASYMHIPTIPRAFIVQMVAHLDIKQQLPDTLQQNLTQLLTLDKLSIYQYNHFYQALRHALADEMIGLLPEAVPLHSQKVLCQMLCYSPDVYSALENYNRFYSLFLPMEQQLLDLSALRIHGQVTLNSSLPNSNSPMFQQSILLALLKIPAWLTGHKVSPRALRVNFDKTPFNAQLNYLFGVIPTYGCRESTLEYHIEELNAPIQLAEQADRFGENFILHTLYWSQSEDIVRYVYAQIHLRLSQGDFSVIGIAAQLNMSKHTLARRLKSAGTSYGQILERVRRDVAIHLLSTSHTPVDEIADSLGFKEVGSFSRAFKRWCGCSPSLFRDKHEHVATNC